MIRTLLVSRGYKLIDEDQYNWAFAMSLNDPPVIVPHNVDLVPLEVAFHIMKTVGFEAYAEAFDQIPWPADASDDIKH